MSDERPDMVVLLQTSERSAQAVVERLEEHELAAWIVDRPNWIAEVLAFGTYRYRVAVRREDEARAQEVLEEWRPEAEARVRDLAGGVQRDLLVAGLLTVPLVMGYGFLMGSTYGWLSAALLSPFVWGGIIVWLGRRRSRAAE